LEDEDTPRRPVRLAATLPLIALIAALVLALAPDVDAAQEPPPAWPTWQDGALRWGGESYQYRSGHDRAAFALWLYDRGVLERFAQRNPQLAVRFGPFWPPNKDAVKRAITTRFAPAGNAAVALALCVSFEESRWHWRAISPTDDHGPWQINRRWHPEVDFTAVYDPWYSARQAWRISDGGQDFGPWHASAKC
jgi:hypothetical protein